MEYLSFNHTCSNHSNFFVLVGNCRDFISQHNTLDEAMKALKGISVGDSKWATIDILEPHETKTLKNLQKTLYNSSAEENAELFDFHDLFPSE